MNATESVEPVSPNLEEEEGLALDADLHVEELLDEARLSTPPAALLRNTSLK